MCKSSVAAFNNFVKENAILVFWQNHTFLKTHPAAIFFTHYLKKKTCFNLNVVFY